MPDFEFGLGLQTPESPSIRSYLSNIDTEDAEMFRAAFAYVTEKGVNQIEEGLSQSLGVTSPEWLVSFDFGYTEPEAIRLLSERGDVRVVGVDPMMEQDNLRPPNRFHPKIIWIKEGEYHHLMVGSSNLTKSAFTRNWESIVLLQSIEASNQSIESLSSWWQEIWEESTPIDEEVLEWYEDLREETNIGPDQGAEDYDEWGKVPDPSDATVIWGHIGYTQGGARNQMDIPTQFGLFFLEEGDRWVVNEEYNVSFKFEEKGILEKKVKYHDGSDQTRIYLPTETQGTRLEDLYSGDKFDEESLRYYIALFRRIRPYQFKLRILPPEDAAEIRDIIEASRQHDQVVETDEDTGRLVGWI